MINSVKQKRKQNGVCGLLAAVPEYIWSRIRLLYYWWKRSLHAGEVVRLSGVQADLSSAVFDPEIATMIRKGRYEAAERKMVRRHLPADTDVVELGAGVGVVSAVIDQQLVDSTHIAVELNPELIQVLNRTKSLNDASFTILNAGYSTAESVVLETGDMLWTTRSAPKSTESDKQTIKGTTLSDLRLQFDIEEFVLVADIEGAEHELFDKELDLIKTSCILAIIEIHDTGGNSSEIHEKLTNSGFSLIDAKPDEDVFVYQNDSIS